MIWLILLVLAGCNQGALNEIEGENSPSPSDTHTGELESREPKATPFLEIKGNVDHMVSEKTPSDFPTPDPVPQSLIIAAKENLARRLDITPEEIQLVKLEAVEWPDASLGCPQSGMTYAQGVTPGFWVILEVEGERYAYHTDNLRKVVNCGSEGAQRLRGDESTDTGNLAKDDLAHRLGISADSIDIVAVIRQEFPADAFYCRTMKERVARDESPAVIPGESILLSAAGRKYEYHASDQLILFCRPLR
jgi:hypothetical protein